MVPICRETFNNPSHTLFLSASEDGREFAAAGRYGIAVVSGDGRVLQRSTRDLSAIIL
jgi:hypothetical protein